MNTRQYSNAELSEMLEDAFKQEDWANYDVIFEELRVRGAFV